MHGTMRSFIDGVDVWNSMHSIRVERSSRLALAKAQVMNSLTVRFAFLDRIKSR